MGTPGSGVQVLPGGAGGDGGAGDAGLVLALVGEQGIRPKRRLLVRSQLATFLVCYTAAVDKDIDSLTNAPGLSPGYGSLSLTGRVRFPAYYCFASMVKPSFLRTVTAPALPPSKSPEARRWPVASS
jgi:hypothetical protein